MKRITCRKCWRTSYNPGDVANGYCAGCRAYTNGFVTDSDDTPEAS